MLLLQRPVLSTFSIGRKSILNPSSASPYSYGGFRSKDNNINLILHSPLLNLKPTRSWNDVTVKISRLNSPLVSPQDDWGTWTALLATGALGLWSEKTKIGSMVSAALVSILIGLAASNLGIIPYEAPAYSVVMKFLLPLTVPLLLFRADMQQVIRATGTLLLPFLLGSVATIAGTLVAFLLVPMRSLGPDNWKIAAALMGSYIGGGKFLQPVLDLLWI